MAHSRSVLIVSINYSPEPTGFAPHVTAFAEHLMRNNRRVTVLTGFPFAPRWARWPEYSGKWLQVSGLVSGTLIRLTHFVPRRPRIVWERLLMEATFCISATVAILGYRPSYDCVVYVGAQPCLAMWCRLLSGISGKPYIVMINDLATGAAEDVGILKTGFLRRMLGAFENAAYSGAARALVLCKSFELELRRAGFRRPIRIIRSPVDLRLVQPRARSMALRHEFGIAADDFVILYAGSMGLKQGLFNAVDAAEKLKGVAPCVRWVFVGDGETREALADYVSRKALNDVVRFWPFQPEHRLSEMFSIADVLLLNQLQAVKDSVIPSKLLTYMAAGRPVVAAVNSTSQGAEILREAGGGVLVRPEAPDELVTALTALMKSESALFRFGVMNREYAEAHFDQQKILLQQEALLDELHVELEQGV